MHFTVSQLYFNQVDFQKPLPQKRENKNVINQRTLTIFNAAPISQCRNDSFSTSLSELEFPFFFFSFLLFFFCFASSVSVLNLHCSNWSLANMTGALQEGRVQLRESVVCEGPGCPVRLEPVIGSE